MKHTQTHIPVDFVARRFYFRKHTTYDAATDNYNEYSFRKTVIDMPRIYISLIEELMILTKI